jgi:hypothetical protein
LGGPSDRCTLKSGKGALLEPDDVANLLGAVLGPTLHDVSVRKYIVKDLPGRIAPSGPGYIRRQRETYLHPFAIGAINYDDAPRSCSEKGKWPGIIREDALDYRWIDGR